MKNALIRNDSQEYSIIILASSISQISQTSAKGLGLGLQNVKKKKMPTFHK